jgi:serine/threonine-protein kinase RsbW
VSALHGCPPSGTPRRLTSEYTSELRSLPLVRRQLDGMLEGSAVEREKVWDIRLAVTEACSNVIRHAYSDRGGTFEVEAELAAGALHVTVRDAGRGSSGGIVPKVGMLLVHEASDAVAIEDANPGLIVRMSFRLG